MTYKILRDVLIYMQLNYLRPHFRQYLSGFLKCIDDVPKLGAGLRYCVAEF